ncbi:hypothetical protein ATI61_106354 [Archangium gephyra]|uniref:Uncharacterized protein n=1 Tax=Archangium gephyra TaxID=48 RepID=A0AAC8Q149_9BACT|nr:hypothetical protein [Archangium gephyra]AKI98975.1 Hypothetical protein AA314_00602 [Archangium gephyra]REG30884.1 hypothetical protein ATI61_106354 [Archangium gephyra]
MADITLGDLLSMLCADLATAVEPSSDEASLKLQVTDVDLDLPAYLRLRAAGPDPEHEPARIILSLPSARETPTAGRLGRVSITLGVRPGLAPEPPEDP